VIVNAKIAKIQFSVFISFSHGELMSWAVRVTVTNRNAFAARKTARRVVRHDAGKLLPIRSVNAQLSSHLMRSGPADRRITRAVLSRFNVAG
jgi:hypothetical protein